MYKILIIDHFSQAPGESGNNRFIYLADLLQKHGYEVEIITSNFHHTAKQTRIIEQRLLDELPYKYTMLSEPVYPKNICLKRFYSHYMFGKHLKTYLKKSEVPDLIYIAIPSLNVGTVSANYCNQKKIPLIVDIQDLWPEAFKLIINIPIISDIAFSPMMRQANYIYAQADRILAVSETYKERGLDSCYKDKDGRCIYLGTDMKAFDENSGSMYIEKPKDEIWIVYVGTLGSSYNIEIIIDALNLIPSNIGKKVLFKVLGDGPFLERFKKYSKGCKFRVDFLGRRSYRQMTAYLSHGDIAVNPIMKGAAQSIINKHADYAMAGLPVINTQECDEYRNLMMQYSCGINCSPDDAQQIADALIALINDEEIRKTMGRNSRQLAEERFDRSKTYNLILEDIERLIKNHE